MSDLAAALRMAKSSKERIGTREGATNPNGVSSILANGKKFKSCRMEFI